MGKRDHRQYRKLPLVSGVRISHPPRIIWLGKIYVLSQLNPFAAYLIEDLIPLGNSGIITGSSFKNCFKNVFEKATLPDGTMMLLGSKPICRRSFISPTKINSSHKFLFPRFPISKIGSWEIRYFCRCCMAWFLSSCCKFIFHFFLNHKKLILKISMPSSNFNSRLFMMKKVRFLTHMPLIAGFGGLERQAQGYLESLSSKYDVDFLKRNEIDFDILHIVGHRLPLGQYFFSNLKAK